MRPVQLLPSGPAVKTTAPGAGTQIGAIVLGGIVLCTVAGFFLMGRLDTVNQETVQATSEKSKVDTDVQTITAQLVEAGNEKDWKSTAQQFREDLFNRLGERIDYSMLTREVTTIKPAGAWYTSVSATNPSATSGVGSSRSIKLEGYAQTMEIVSSLVTRVDATDSMTDARLGDIEYLKDSKGRTWVQFAIDATLQDAAKLLDTPDPANPGSVVVANGGTEELALEPEPGFERRKAAAEKAAEEAAKEKAQAKALADAKSAAISASKQQAAEAKLARQHKKSKKSKKQTSLTNLEKVVKQTGRVGG